MDISSSLAVVNSAAEITICMLLGGLYSVSWNITPFYQQSGRFIFLLSQLAYFWDWSFFTLFLSLFFFSTVVLEFHQEPWIGKLEMGDVGRWIDELLVLVKDC